MQYWIIDIDHVLWREGRAIEGSQEALEMLRDNNVNFRLLTNDSVSGVPNKTRRLQIAGFDIEEDEVLTASILTGRYLMQANLRTPIILASDAAIRDVGIESVADPELADCVVIGDIFKSYSFDRVRVAIKALVRGVPLIAMQRNKWCGPREFAAVDVGFWVAAFEYVVERTALVIGKPAQYAFQLALDAVGCDAFSLALMVGDDLEVDLQVPARLGMRTVHIAQNPSSSKMPAWLDESHSCLLDAVRAHYG